jgi:methionyl-tRNA formyltransferase
MPRKIALFANGNVGLAVAKYLASSGDEVKILYLSNQYPESDHKIRVALSGIKDLKIARGDIRLDLASNLELIKETKVDALITVYWPFILPNQVLDLIELTLNFHPALLPTNRGWYPHVHNILNGSLAGVTLHKLSERADEGDVWAQKEVTTYPWDCAGDLYNRLQEEITELFIEKWPSISNNLIAAIPQGVENQSYHSKKEIEGLDRIDLDQLYTGSQFLNLLRARTFGPRGFAFFESGEDKIYIKIDLERVKKEDH